jgi:hypothetical protein
MAHVTIKRNDRILLCSDGLHDYFPIEEEIAQKLSVEKPGAALQEMVDLAKTRGGHDNITGVAIQVTEIVEANVPEAMSGESTQPVDLGTNPFADEPTETALVAPPGVPPRMPGGQGMKVTTPMRVVNEESHADTIPPDAGKKPVKLDSDDKKEEAKPETTKTDDKETVRMPPIKIDAPSSEKPAETKGDGAPKQEAEKSDSVPNEIAHADTGRTKAIDAEANPASADKDKDKAPEPDKDKST